MTHGERLDLICATLLLPFTDPSYGAYDPISEKAACFRRFLQGEGREIKLYSRYRELQSNILRSITARAAKPQRLDELAQVLDLFYGDGDLTQFLEKINTGSPGLGFPLDDFYIQRIAEISDSFITLRDGHPALRTWHNQDRKDLFPNVKSLHKAEIWNMLVRESTPDLWIAGYFAFSPHITLAMLYNIPDEPILADRVLMDKLSQGLADTHTHFHAGMNYQVQWELVTDLTALRCDKSTKKDHLQYLCIVLKAGLLRLMLADYLQTPQTNQEDFLDYCRKQLTPPLYEVLYAAVCSGEITDPACERCLATFISWREQLYSYFPDLRSSPIPGQRPWSDSLIRSVYQKWHYLNTSGDILLFFQALQRASQTQAPQFCHALLQYIRLKNHFFKAVTQPETIHGLRQFREYFSLGRSIVHVLRDSRVNEGQNIEHAIFLSYTRQPYLRLLEIKISPPRLDVIARTEDEQKIICKGRIRKQLRSLFTAYCSVLDELAIYNRDGTETPQQTLDRLSKEKNLSVPTLGIVYHFLKLDEKRSFYRQICWADEAQEKERGDVYPETLRNVAMLFCDSLTDLFQEVPHLAEYVVGIDAASDEMHHEPWVYAPVFRYARSRHNTYPIQPNTKRALPNLGLTYHVGEEFRMLLSGLRVIDEVIEQFGFKTGDRIGHAVAMQVEPRVWQYENSTVVLPTIEYLENLLWLWNLKGQSEFGSALASIPDLEQKIMHIASQLYPNYEGLSPYLLWRGYQLKFQPVSQDILQQIRQKSTPLCKYGSMHCSECPVFRKSGRSVCRSAFAAGMDTSGTFSWTEYDLLLSHLCPAFKKRYSKPMFVTTTKDDVKLLAELQQYLREKIERRGLTVEVNPSSNSAISEIQHLFGHPMLKLNDYGLASELHHGNHISITINTDDPLIFRTTVEHEISYVYYMLLDSNYRQTDVLNWIEHIRQTGIDRSFIRRTKEPSVQYNEIKEMLQSLQDKQLSNE